MSIVIKDETAKTKLSANLVKAMERTGITQAELARRTGESNARLMYYRRGMKLPSLAVASRIAEALGCTVDDLLK